MSERVKQALVSGIDRKLAIIIALLGLVLLLFAIKVLGSLLLTQVSVTLLLAAGIYLLVRNRRKSKLAEEDVSDTEDDSSHQLLRPVFSQSLDIIYWGLLITSLLVISRGVYSRPLIFLIIVSVMCSILAVQIFMGKNAAYCLIKVLIIGILLRASAWFQFPSAVGSDPIVEVNNVQQLLATGHTGNYMGGYIYYPIAYLLDAFLALTSGLVPKDSFFIISVIEVSSLVFIYLAGSEIFNKKVGLLAILILAVFDWHVFNGFWLKAMTLGIAWLAMLIFLLLRSRQKGGLVTFSVLSILTIFLIILTHTFISAAMVVFLIMAWLSYVFTKDLQDSEKIVQPVTLTIVLISLTAVLGYWLYASGFIMYIGSAINYALNFDTGGIAMFSIPRDSLVLTWQKLPLLLLIFFTILGSLSILNIRRLDRKVTLQIWLVLIAGAIVVLDLVLFAIPQLGALESMRWHVIMGIIVAMPAAYGLVNFLERSWRGLTALFLSVLMLSGIMTTSHIANVDLVIPWDHQSRHAFISSEITGAETLSKMAGLLPSEVPGESTKVYADFLYSLLFKYDINTPIEKVDDGSYIYKGEETQYHGILMLRTAMTEVVSAAFEGGHEDFVMSKSQYQSWINDPQSQLIYDNGIVKALQRP